MTKAFYRPPGLLLDERDDKLFTLRWNCIINAEGQHFGISDEIARYQTLRERLEPWLRVAERQRNAFLLWIFHYSDAPRGVIPRTLSEQNFRAPSITERAEILGFSGS